jgi:CHASE2 domain-containing sensor protein
MRADWLRRIGTSYPNIQFKRIEGGYLFFPWSQFGRAYQIDERTKDELAVIVGASLIGSLVAFGAVVFVKPWWPGAIALLLMLACYHFATMRKVRGARRTNALLQ